MKKITHIVGTRPNLIKMAPLVKSFYDLTDYEQTIVHTGQHYDFNMSQVFFNELKIPVPDYHLRTGSANHACQTGNIMIHLDNFIENLKPDIVVVYGDVNSTLAASLVAAKRNILLAHVEAGLRSFDRTMPEEINRIVTDVLSDILLTPSCEATDNLVREGIFADKIHFVGNIMIDTLVANKDNINHAQLKDLEIPEEGYALVTLHRPSNVDNTGYLALIMDTLKEISKNIPLIFPAHPRTIRRLVDIGCNIIDANIAIIEPVSYLQCLSLQKDAEFVITDSGGIQEETTFLGVPCITVRDNTERMITVLDGTNVLVDRNPLKIVEAVDKILSHISLHNTIPALWDGKTSARIVNIIVKHIHNK